MKTIRTMERSLVLALALVCAAMLWPAGVSADHDHHKKKHRKHRHSEVVERHNPWPVWKPRVHRPVYYAPPPARCYGPPPVRARYYHDPYCRENFVSLAIYRDHVRRHRHARFAWVMQAGFEQPLFAFHYEGDRWVRWDDEHHHHDD
jgi:hypothetical protein